MQAKSLRLKGLRQSGLPILDHFIEKMELSALLGGAISHKRYVDAILLLVKNVLIEHQALYAIRQWSSQYDPGLVYGGRITDDVIARALDRLFEADRATLQTKIVLKTIEVFQIDTSEIHNDSTSIKVSGRYENQRRRGLKLKRGHSKDHRPDLKQLLYNLTVSADGAIPVHYKTYDGNRTDDTTHWDTWSALRALFLSPDFLYVADSKLCTEKQLRKIDGEHGKFITVLPRTRHEVGEFYNSVYCLEVRWDYLYKKRCTRKKEEYDIFELAEGFYQTQEGFRIYWYRSSKKKQRDEQDRRERIELVFEQLSKLAQKKRRGPKSEKSLRKSAERIISKYKTSRWISVDIQFEKLEVFKQLSRGRSTAQSTYRKVIKQKPRLVARRNQQEIDRSKSVDGVFPLVTNTTADAIEVLKHYKYQPNVEKRHSQLKSTLEAAPIRLKRNDRIEALMFALFLAQMVASLIERQIRKEMRRQKIQELPSLPENRKSKTPTTEQMLRLFEHRTYHQLYRGKRFIKQFSDPLTPVQSQVLKLLRISDKNYVRP
jgi:transposase